MENETGEYEPIDDSAPKPFSARSLATIFIVVAVTSVGVFCALFFTIGGVSSSTTSGISSIVDNHLIIGERLGCTTVPSTSTGLQCAFYNSSSSWLCLDQDEPTLLMDMSFLSTLGTTEDSLLSAAKGETKDTILCSASGTLWVCVFLTSLNAVGSELTSTFNADDLLCTRTLHADWLCWKADQEITFSQMATLSSTLLPTYRADHTIGCLLSAAGTWECGELYNCIYQRNLDWACWGGNVTTTTVSSVPWFANTREMLLRADLTHRKSAVNVTGQMCYFHPKQGKFRCASENDEIGLQEAAFYNGTLQSTFQCAYTDGEWLCLRDLDIHGIRTLQSFQTCVDSTTAAETTTAESAGALGYKEDVLPLLADSTVTATTASAITTTAAVQNAEKRKIPSSADATLSSSSSGANGDGDVKAQLAYAVGKAATHQQERRRQLRQGTPQSWEMVNHNYMNDQAVTGEGGWKAAFRRLTSSGHETQISVRCTRLPDKWACSFLSFGEV